MRIDEHYSLAVWARSTGAWGNRIEFSLRPGTRTGVRFTVKLQPMHAGAPGQDEDYDNMSVSSDGPNPLHERVNQESELVYIRYDAFVLPLDLSAPLAGGLDGSPLRAGDYTGTTPGIKGIGLCQIGALDDIDLICVPDHVHPSLPVEEQNRLTDELIVLCERTADRLALLATPRGEHDPERLKPRHDTRFAAAYYPWLRDTTEASLVPPIGHVAGAFARHDAEMGVHSAPLGLCLNGVLEDALEIEASPELRDRLTRLGLNVLVMGLTAGQPCLVTAYNLAIDEQTRFINVSRFGNFLLRSIERGLAWTAFEPHGEPLYARVREQISAFLGQLWDSGVLGGERPEEGFLVRCDSTTMTADDVAKRRLITLCSVALAGPPVTIWLQFTLSSGPPAEAASNSS